MCLTELKSYKKKITITRTSCCITVCSKLSKTIIEYVHLGIHTQRHTDFLHNLTIMLLEKQLITEMQPLMSSHNSSASHSLNSSAYPFGSNNLHIQTGCLYSATYKHICGKCSEAMNLHEKRQPILLTSTTAKEWEQLTCQGQKRGV